jgi:DNA-binding Xre family transcriptional regulator
MLMRLRFPELLEEHDLTAYEVAKRSNKRISRSWAYRAKKLRGKLGTFGAVELEALCDVFGVEPTALLERDKKRSR